VYDPLISWRLLNTAAKQPSPDQPKHHQQVVQAPVEDDEFDEYREDEDHDNGVSMAASLRIHRTESQLMRAGVSMAPDGSMAASMKENTPSSDACSVADDFKASDHSTAQSEAITRIHNKLNGHDIEGEENLDVDNQVRLLIDQATSLTNLSKSFKGWCPFW